MNFLNRVPQPNRDRVAPVRLLQMPEDEYAALLREHGFGERYIAKELAQLREARARQDLPGPPVPNQKQRSGDDTVAGLAKKRRDATNF